MTSGSNNVHTELVQIASEAQSGSSVKRLPVLDLSKLEPFLGPDLHFALLLCRVCSTCSPYPLKTLGVMLLI